jgi:site-specific DNA recombinase
LQPSLVVKETQPCRDKRIEELQTELLKLTTSNADYEKVGNVIHPLRYRKQKLQLENANRDELKKRMNNMSTFLRKQSTALTKYNEQLVWQQVKTNKSLPGNSIQRIYSSLNLNIKQIPINPVNATPGKMLNPQISQK